MKVENVIKKLEVKLAGKLDEWECTIETNGYEDYKCSLSDLRKKTVLNFIPKQSSKNTLQQKQQKQQKKEEKGGASLAAQQLNLADDKINKLLRKYAPVGIAAAVFVALVLVIVFVPGLWTSEGNKESVSLKTTDSVEVQAKIVLVDRDGDLIKRTDIKDDNYFNTILSVFIDGVKLDNLKNRDEIQWEIKKKIPVNDSVGVKVVVHFDNEEIANTEITLNTTKDRKLIKVKVSKKLSEMNRKEPDNPKEDESVYTDRSKRSEVPKTKTRVSEAQDSNDKWFHNRMKQGQTFDGKNPGSIKDPALRVAAIKYAQLVEKRKVGDELKEKINKCGNDYKKLRKLLNGYSRNESN